MRGRVLVPFILMVLVGCEEQPTETVNNRAEINKLEVIIDNKEKSESSIKSYGYNIKTSIEERNFEGNTEIHDITTNENRLKIQDFIAKIIDYEEQILEEENSIVAPTDDDGNYLYTIEEKTIEDVKGTVEYFEFFNKDDGSIEQYFLYTNGHYKTSLRIVWLGSEMYYVE